VDKIFFEGGGDFERTGEEMGTTLNTLWGRGEMLHHFGIKVMKSKDHKDGIERLEKSVRAVNNGGNSRSCFQEISKKKEKETGEELKRKNGNTPWENWEEPAVQQPFPKGGGKKYIRKGGEKTNSLTFAGEKSLRYGRSPTDRRSNSPKAKGGKKLLSKGEEEETRRQATEKKRPAPYHQQERFQEGAAGPWRKGRREWRADGGKKKKKGVSSGGMAAIKETGLPKGNLIPPTKAGGRPRRRDDCQKRGR